jgi:hypothetical protein
MVNNKLDSVQERCPDLIQGIIPAFIWRNWGKPQKISQKSQYPGQDLKTAPPKYKPKVLTSEPTHQVSSSSVEDLNKDIPDR